MLCALWLSPRLIDGAPAFMAHEIVSVRRLVCGLQYLVDWEGYGPEEQSLISPRLILDHSLLCEFHQRFPDKPGRESGVAPWGGALSWFTPERPLVLLFCTLYPVLFMSFSHFTFHSRRCGGPHTSSQSSALCRYFSLVFSSTPSSDYSVSSCDTTIVLHCEFLIFGSSFDHVFFSLVDSSDHAS